MNMFSKLQYFLFFQKIPTLKLYRKKILEKIQIPNLKLYNEKKNLEKNAGSDFEYKWMDGWIFLLSFCMNRERKIYRYSATGSELAGQWQYFCYLTCKITLKIFKLVVWSAFTWAITDVTISGMGCVVSPIPSLISLAFGFLWRCSDSRANICLRSPSHISDTNQIAFTYLHLHAKHIYIYVMYVSKRNKRKMMSTLMAIM